MIDFRQLSRSKLSQELLSRTTGLTVNILLTQGCLLKAVSRKYQPQRNEQRALKMSTVSTYYDLNKYSTQLQESSLKLISCNTWYKAPLGILGLAASVIARVVEGVFMSLANAFLFLKYMCPTSNNPPSIQRPIAKTPQAKPTPRTRRAAPSELRPPLLLLTNERSREQQIFPLEPLVMHSPVLSPLQRSQSLESSPFTRGTLSIEDPLAVHSPVIDSPVINLSVQNNPPLDVSYPPVEVVAEVVNDEIKTYGTRIQARMFAGFSALRHNKIASIATAGVAGIAAAGVISLVPPLLPIAGALAVSKYAWDKLKPTNSSPKNEIIG